MDRMRAVVIAEPGGPNVLEVRDVPAPRSPASAEIRVRVRAAGVNRADLLQRRGRYPAPPGWPQEIPGLEYAGEVESVGADVSEWQPGDRVMGLVGGGAYAEYVVVHERSALPVPEELSLEQAAAVPEAFITAHDALFERLALRPGGRVLIHAVGSGVGTAALQLAKAAGARTLGTSRTDWKLERARELGLDVAIDTAAGPAFHETVRRETDGEGVDAVLDLVGGPYLPENIRSMATSGRIVIVGLTGGAAAELDMGAVLRNRLTIVGTALRSRPLEQKVAAARAFYRDSREGFRSGRIAPVVDRVYKIEDAGAAHEQMEANANLGAIVLSID